MLSGFIAAARDFWAERGADFRTVTAENIGDHYQKIWSSGFRYSLSLILFAAFCLIAMASDDSTLLDVSNKLETPVGKMPFRLFRLAAPVILVVLYFYFRTHIVVLERLRELAHANNYPLPPTVTDRTSRLLRVGKYAVTYVLMPILFLGFSQQVYPLSVIWAYVYAVGASAFVVAGPFLGEKRAMRMSWLIAAVLIAVMWTGLFRFEFADMELGYLCDDVICVERNFIFYNQTMSEWDLRRMDLARADFNFAKLQGTDFSFAAIHDATFSQANLEGADMTWVLAINTKFPRTEMADIGFDGACFADAEFKRSNLTDASLSDGYFIDADFRGARLWYADMDRACLEGANFSKADLRGVDLSGVYGLDPKQLVESCMGAAPDMPEGDCDGQPAVLVAAPEGPPIANFEAMAKPVPGCSTILPDYMNPSVFTPPRGCSFTRNHNVASGPSEPGRILGVHLAMPSCEPAENTIGDDEIVAHLNCTYSRCVARNRDWRWLPFDPERAHGSWAPEVICP